MFICLAIGGKRSAKELEKSGKIENLINVKGCE